MATFESQNRRMPKIEACLKANGLESLDACNEMLLAKGIDCDKIIRGIQPICFDNAVWAYTLGTAIAVKRGLKSAADCAAAIGEGLEAFTIPGSVAEQRKVGLGHGNLGAMLLHEDTHCFAFLAGHESFAAAEGAIGIARTANKVRKEPLRVILNGLGKDAAQIISRINGFTYVKTDYDFATGELKVVETIPYSDGERAAVKCYGANDVLEGVAIMKAEGVEVSITGNSTNPTRFQHLVAGYLQEVGYREWQEVLLRCFRRRHGPYPAPGQRGSRPRFLRPDRLHGPYARRCSVRWFLLRPGSRRDDGSDRRRQQPDGRYDCRLRCCCFSGQRLISFAIVYGRNPVCGFLPFFMPVFVYRTKVT